jgi:hypothetical protein
MTSRERVRRCLEFDRPDRVPRDLWVLPAAAKRLGPAALDGFRARWPADIVQVTAGAPKPRREAGVSHQLGHYTDEWGCTFVSLVDGILGEVKAPLIDDYARLDDVLRVPEELLAVDRAAANAWCRAEDRFVLASGWPRPFERMQFLRGTEDLLMDIAEDSDGFRELLRRVHDFYCRQLEIWAGTAADGLAVMDDWGSQQALLISPAAWRRHFKPLYADYARIARDHGKKFFFHSDGHIAAIYPDLIEVGVDALNSQLFCMDLDELARMAKGRLTFWGEIDRQHVLPSGTPETVAAAVDRVVDTLWSADGGCIAQFELTPETSLENAEAVYRAWERRTSSG